MTATDTNPIPLNRLARETSPYLLQHARNPVEWYPWGEEAFAKARREGKPIFLSVGYSTCHWCHVMAHESFEDPAVARIMNRFFVCVKVDREQRPEIDRLYMSYVQSATHGRGGWPMSVWLTPDLKPFYGGTYFPPDDRYGFPGFVRVLESLAEAWRTARPKLEAAGDEAIRLLASAAARAPSAEQVGEDTLDAAAAAFLSEYDARYGGFGGAPKFPRPAVFTFLLDHSARTGEPSARDAVLHTLRRMADGGICDQLGGGFHRYATDEAWQIPHFEKMLYDQAQLVCAYLDAWLATCDPIFADIARVTLDYVRRDLAGADGGFLSAEDADSPLPDVAGSSGEGAFYTWTAREVREALGDEEGKRFGQAFGLDRPGNVIDGRHVLAVTGDEARKLLARHRDALLDMRASRPRPHRDDKVLTAWNGLMVGACARAYQVLERPDDLASAQRAAAFVRSRLFDAASGRLHRSWRDGRASGEGFAEDYAFLIHGLLALYEADFHPAHLDWALALQEKLDALFWDEANGGYFCSADGAADVLVRMKETHDGAEPAAGSIAALNLLWLAALTDEAKYRERADALLAFFGRRLREQPESLPLMLAARARSLCPPQQIVIAGARDAEDTRALLRVVRQHPSRNRVVLLADSGPGQTVLTRLQPALGQMRPLGGRAAAYVCQAFTCRSPVTDPEALGALLKQCNEELGMRN